MTVTLEQLDPATLIVGENVRGDARLDPQFLASIAERGVLEPVAAHRDPNTHDVVVDRGKRRTLAACRAGLDSIPVLVRSEPEPEVDRVVDQVVENEHRAPLTNTERVRAVEQMALLGLSAGQIAQRVAMPRDHVNAAQLVARSGTAIAHVDDDGITLEHAAILAEFDGDEDATRQLLDQLQSRPDSLAARAQRIRDDRAEQAVLDAFAAELTAQGLTVIEHPGYTHKTIRPLDELRNGKRRIDPERHAADCPGHVVWVKNVWSNGGRDKQPTAVPGCDGWAKHGHVDPNGTAKVPAADMTDEQRDQARRERRHVIESNKDWKAATTIRRQWLVQFALRKTAPDGAEAYLAAAILNGGLEHAGISPYLTDDHTGCFEHIGLGSQALRTELLTATPKRSLQILLVLVLGAWEASLPDDAWRSTYVQDATVRALNAISQWGHQLSDIEQRMVDGTAAELQS